MDGNGRPRPATRCVYGRRRRIYDSVQMKPNKKDKHSRLKRKRKKRTKTKQHCRKKGKKMATSIRVVKTVERIAFYRLVVVDIHHRNITSGVSRTAGFRFPHSVKHTSSPFNCFSFPPREREEEEPVEHQVGCAIGMIEPIFCLLLPSGVCVDFLAIAMDGSGGVGGFQTTRVCNEPARKTR